MRRKIDDLGRVVLPVQFRRALDIAEGDELEITLEDSQIVVTRPRTTCTFCGAEGEMTAFRDRLVCWSCTAALRALDREHTDAPKPGGVSYF